MKWEKIELIFELLIFGIAVGIIEDLIAIKLTTTASIDLRVVGIVILIAIPFAILGELIIDRVDFVQIFKKIFKKNK